MAAALTSLLLLLAPSALAQDTTADDAQALLERELGFEFAEPWSFSSRFAQPSFIECETPDSLNCLHGTMTHWEYFGIFGGRRGTRFWGDIPPWEEWLLGNGWDYDAERDIYLGPDRGDGTCRTFEMTPIADAEEIRMHVFPCSNATAHERGNLFFLSLIGSSLPETAFLQESCDFWIEEGSLEDEVGDWFTYCIEMPIEVSDASADLIGEAIDARWEVAGGGGSAAMYEARDETRCPRRFILSVQSKEPDPWMDRSETENAVWVVMIPRNYRFDCV